MRKRFRRCSRLTSLTWKKSVLVSTILYRTITGRERRSSGFGDCFGRDDVTKSKIDLSEVLTEISRIVRADALLRNISLRIEVKSALPLVLAELLQLQQAVINLILNAFDAVAPIVNRAREVLVEASVVEGGDSLELLVRDTGVGIAPEAISHIFDPFFTTKPEGMGIGLAITKSIIEAHGGTLTASPESHRGTTFAIRIPIAKEGIS
jgi:signal transduction histidine kinase